jgi:hypothetical protein
MLTPDRTGIEITIPVTRGPALQGPQRLACTRSTRTATRSSPSAAAAPCASASSAPGRLLQPRVIAATSWRSRPTTATPATPTSRSRPTSSPTPTAQVDLAVAHRARAGGDHPPHRGARQRQDQRAGHPPRDARSSRASATARPTTSARAPHHGARLLRARRPLHRARRGPPRRARGQRRGRRAPTGTFQIGAGFSSMENFIATAQIQQLNLFGRGQSLTLQAQISGSARSSRCRFVEPYLLDSNWTFAVDLYNRLRATRLQFRTSTGGTLTFGYPSSAGPAPLRHLHGEKVERRPRHLHVLRHSHARSAFQQLPLANIFQSGFTSSPAPLDGLRHARQPPHPTDGIYARLGVDSPTASSAARTLHPRTGLVPLLLPALLDSSSSR